jgi:hypothetical protein
MPDDLQLKHERFSGEKVFEILGILHSEFRHGNPDDFEPDLIFKTGEHHIGIEVTSAYPEDDPRFGDQGHLKINAPPALRLMMPNSNHALPIHHPSEFRPYLVRRSASVK